MKLHHLRPAEGSKKRKIRVGRGESGRRGKTAGRGTKGLKARSKVRRGFEGGQMPLNRRLPKRGFSSRKARLTDEVRLHEIASVAGDTVGIAELRAAGLIGRFVHKVTVIASGRLERALTVKGLRVTKGARAAIEAAGGKVETE